MIGMFSISSAKSETLKSEKIYRREEIERHTDASTGVWVTHRDGVYDITSFIANHPGGKEKIMMAAGCDLSELWRQLPFQLHYQSPLVFELLEEYRIGNLHPDDVIISDPTTFEQPTLKYPTNKIYDCIVIGSGVSGLQAAKALTTEHGIPSENILVLEAQDYVGGRVRQMGDFIQGVKIDMGAEFLHGSNTLLTKFARETKQPLREIFCWAHGDGGPLDAPVNQGYGLYFLKDRSGRRRLLRFDDSDPDFVRMNRTLQGLAHLNEDDYSDDLSLHDYLSAQGFSDEMMAMAAGGFANTLCTNSRDLALKRCIYWCRLWEGDHGTGPEGGDEEEDGDYTFANSYACLIDHLKEGLQIETRSPVAVVQYPESDADVMAGLVRLQTSPRGDAAAGATYFARSAVITSSPHALRSGLMQFHPALPPDLQEGLHSVNMHNITKVFLKFKVPVWPEHLHGMIFTDDSTDSTGMNASSGGAGSGSDGEEGKESGRMLIPEMWFRIVKDEVVAGEQATAYVVGFCTSEYARRVAAMPKDEVLRRAVAQLDEAFSLLRARHMSGDADKASDEPNSNTNTAPPVLPKASEEFLGGMFWDWNPGHHPYIGGGYCSPRAGTRTGLIEQLRVPLGRAGNVFFAGEATNVPGATAHAALESGVRAAAMTAAKLKGGTAQ